MDHSSRESLTGSLKEYEEYNFESNSRPSSANTIKPRLPCQTTDLLPRPSSCASDRSTKPSNEGLPLEPSSTTDISSRTPSFGTGCLPKPTSCDTGRSPKPPSCGIGRTPRPPSCGTGRSPRPPSPVARDLLPRSRPGSLKTSGTSIRRTFASRPGSNVSNQLMSMEGTSRPNSPKLPTETDRMGLGGNTDALIAFYETANTKQSFPDVIQKLSPRSPSNTSVGDNMSLKGSLSHTANCRQSISVPRDTKEGEGTGLGIEKLNPDPNPNTKIDGEIYDGEIELSVMHATGLESEPVSDVNISPNAEGIRQCNELEVSGTDGSLEYSDNIQVDEKLDGKNLRYQDNMANKDYIQTHDDLQNTSSVDGASLNPYGMEQHETIPNTECLTNVDAEDRRNDIDTDKPVIQYPDVSRMANASDVLKQTWRKLIETNLQTLETLRVQKQASDEIHNSYCMEYDRIRDEVMRLYNDNGRKSYLVDEIRLKYPDMVDEYDELRPMSEIKNQFIRNREDKIEMESNMPRIYHQFLQDKLQIERSLGMDCSGYPLKVFVDQYNEMRVGKVEEEKQKLNLMDAFPMPDLMTRVDKSKSGKYPVFKIIKDGHHFVMNNNGLINVMPRHKELIEEDDDRLEDNDDIGSLCDEKSKLQESQYNRRDHLFRKFPENKAENVDFENEKTIKGKPIKFKLGAGTISLIQKMKLDSNAHQKQNQAKKHEDESDMSLELSLDSETRGRRKTKAEENQAKLKPQMEINGQGITGRDDGICGRQLQLTQLVPKGRNRRSSPKKIKHVQTPRRESSKGDMKNVTNKMVLPPVVAHGKDRRMADMNAAMQKNMKDMPQDRYTPNKLENKSKLNVGDYDYVMPSSKQNFKEVHGIKDSARRLPQPGYKGYGDSNAAAPHTTVLNPDVSSKGNDRAAVARDIGVAKSRATRAFALNTPTTQRETQKVAMRVDNHDYNRKPRPPTSTIRHVPERLPAIPKGCMTTTKAAHPVVLQSNRQPSGKVRGNGSEKRVDSGGRKKLIDVNDISSLIQHRKRE